MAKHPTNKRRAARQKLKGKYAKVREEAQLRGIIPTVPEGAVRGETVPPETQEEQSLPSLDRMAARGWATPEHKKPLVVDRLVGIVEAPESKPIDVTLAAKALLTADKMQHERDHPREQGKMGIGITVTAGAVDPMDLWRRSLEAAGADEVEERLKREESKHAEQRSTDEERTAESTGDGPAKVR